MIERVRRDPAIRLDPHVANSLLIYDHTAKRTMANIYKEYVDVGRDCGLALMIAAPTWRANPHRLRACGGYDCLDVNRDAVRFVREIRDSYGTYGSQVAIAGLMGCAGDAYKAEESLDRDEAAAFHRPQANALAKAGVDVLLGATLPAAAEAHGMAIAMAERSVPYIISLVIHREGTLLDDTPLYEFIMEVDSCVFPKPLAYLANCVHPAVFCEAYGLVAKTCPVAAARLVGLQANTSPLCPEELDNRTELDTDNPSSFADQMMAARIHCDLTILGGCCGTDERHIRAIGERLQDHSANSGTLPM